MQLILLIALGPIAYIAFRLYWTIAKFTFNLLFLFICVVLIFGLSFASKSFQSPIPSQQKAEFMTEDIQVSACADVEQLLTDPLGIGELCDRYYKGEQCKPEIEAGFERVGHQLAPMLKCGSFRPPAAPMTSMPESFNNKVVNFLETVPKSERQSQFMKLHEVRTIATSSLTLDEVRSTDNLPAFLAFSKPTDDALSKAIAGAKALGGVVVLSGVPTFDPLTGIVRGIYERNPSHECSVRLRDHSLCIEREATIKCNVYSFPITENEQVCVDYLIR